MKSKNIISLVTGLALVGSLAVALPAFAQTNQGDGQGSQQGEQDQQGGNMIRTTPAGVPGSMGQGRGGMGMKPAVIGTVSAVNGDTITLSGHQGFGSTTTAVIYTVDATNAKITKLHVCFAHPTNLPRQLFAVIVMDY